MKYPSDVPEVLHSQEWDRHDVAVTLTSEQKKKKKIESVLPQGFKRCHVHDNRTGKNKTQKYHASNYSCSFCGGIKVSPDVKHD